MNVKYQLVCPKCHHEFQYDNGYIDKNIATLAHEISDIMKQLAEYKLLPLEERRRKRSWRKRAVYKITCKQQEIQGLKEIRKVSDQQIKFFEYSAFKSLVREMFGEAVFNELIRQTEEEIKAYKVSGLMRHEYTRAGGGGITSINKL